MAARMGVFNELIHRTNAAVVIHLTPTDHTGAVAALNASKPYLVVTMTTDHSKFLIHRIAQWIFEQLSTETNSMTGWYDAELATTMKKATGEPVAKAKAKAKARAKGKAKEKAPKRSNPQADSDDGGEAPPEKKKAKAGNGALAAIQAALSEGVAEGGKMEAALS